MNSSKFGLISFICGIVALCTGSVGVGVAAGVAAIIFSVKSKAANGPHWMSTVGLIGGIIGIVYGLPATICTIACGGGLGELLSSSSFIG